MENVVEEIIENTPLTDDERESVNVLVDDKRSVFDTLNAIDVSEYIEKKGRFNYLPWADAWRLLKQQYPYAASEDHEFVDETGQTQPYMSTNHGCFVKVTVSVETQDETETYPVLDYNNKPIVEPNAFDINTALKRCLVKAIARHGLGLYIYAGEDLPPDKTTDGLNQDKQDRITTSQLKTIKDLADKKRIDRYLKEKGYKSLKEVSYQEGRGIIAQLEVAI